MLGPVRTPGDGDLYWQRWLGDLILHTHRLPAALGVETFTAAGAPWVPQEWLFSLAVALAQDHHVFALLAIVFSAIPLGILISIYWRARDDATDPAAIGLAMLFCGAALLVSFGVRAQILGWAALSVFMLFIERRDRWYYAALPTVVVWANLHASVAIAPAIVLARLAGCIADGGLRSLRASRDLFMLPAVTFGILCTPFGARLPALAVGLATSPIRHYIQEWQSPATANISFAAGVLPLAIAIIAGGRTTLLQRKLEAFPAALLFLATLFASRNAALFAIVAAPLAARGLQARFPSVGKLGARIAELEPIALPAIIVASLLSGLALIRLQQREPPPLPVAPIASVARDVRTNRVFCENFAWCSVALAYPSLRVFIDGRADPYPLTIWRQYVATISAGSGWSDPLDRYRVNYVIVRRGGRLESALKKTPSWTSTYKDVSYVVFRRN